MDSKAMFSKLLKAHVYQLNNDYPSSERILLNHKPQLDKDSIYLIATWLWNVQNHLKEINSESLKAVNVQPYLTFLQDNWRKPFERIWGDGKKDIYVSNIAMVYAALTQSKNYLQQYELQKTITEIRDFVFDFLLSGGMLLDAVNERQISLDMLTAVMPYGLFSPEDLIVVEAVGQIERQLVNNTGVLKTIEGKKKSSSATALLSLYFLEKGNYEKANTYLNLAKGLIEKESTEESELGKVIIEMIDHYKVDSIEEYKIVHTPFGNHNIYEPQLTERSPHNPTTEEPITVACQVWPEGEVDSVLLTLKSTSGETVKKNELTRKYLEDKKVYIWTGIIEPQTKQEEFSYQFSAFQAENLKVQSEWFPITPLKRRVLNEFRLFEKAESEVVLLAKDEDGFSLQINLGFNEDQFYINIDSNINQEFLQAEYEAFTLRSMNQEFTIDLQIDPFFICIKDANKTLLKSHDFLSFIECTTDENQFIRDLRLNLHTPMNESFYGFGERYNAVEQRGNIIDCYVYNQYRDQGTRTYIPVPFYISSMGYGLVVNTNRYTHFDIAHSLKDAMSIKIRMSEKEQSTFITAFFGTPKEVIETFTSKTGKPVLPPVWAFGPWMSSNNWDRDSLTRSEVEKTNEYQIPATVLVLEQWSDEATYYMFNDAQYDVKVNGESHSYNEIEFPEWGRWPDPKGLFEYLHDNGLKVLLWQIPIKKYLNRQTHPQKDADEKYMLKNGYVVKKKDGSPYRMPEGWFKESLLMDFSNEVAKEWWFSKRKYLLEIGVDGFKTDGGEFVFGDELLFADGKTGDEMRNLYPNDYIEAYYQFANDFKSGDSMTFSRAGYMGAQNFPAHWAGDERSTFDAFKRSLAAGITSGMSGIPFWGWDLAGFNGDIPTAELFVRSAAMAAFCPIMQYHAESKGEFNQDRTPWNIAERTNQYVAIEGYRFYANVRMNLLPYIWNEARKTSETGIPLMRSLFMENPEDQRGEGVFDQYYFGSSLLVAPVTEEGATSRKVYFPEGNWFDFWNGKRIIGPAYELIDSPLDHIPVYVKEGSVILTNVDQTLQLGSWVSNDITSYVRPLLRVYLKDGLSERINDHLNNQWSVDVIEESDRWRISVSGPTEEFDVYLPDEANSEGKAVFVNGKKKA
ncbi:TIM-barrel domain-containing protein [Bacillus sp. ISL-39]|uniref:glycoside hydrolase family 31 protein n=1 Tax=Bacillus sp. ISL-39 TaxID=2819124 RepID=UPI001BEA3A84|nr:TIM-barrel domain-containing protein [Bacillus sp. ISL-39]MBT2640563.1 glycoside hydrolase family 31 protein [Bacillus sp. ISL-39]